MFKTFDNLPVYKKAHQMTLKIYRITKTYPSQEKFGLVSQLRRSSSSICANLVEGLHRNSRKELIQYLYNARGSCGETIYHLILSRDLEYINHKAYKELRNLAEEITKQLNGWIKSEKGKLTT